MPSIEIVRIKGKKVYIKITNELKIVVSAPTRMPRAEIDRILSDKKDWIDKNLELVKKRNREREKEKKIIPLTQEEKLKLKKEASEIIPKKVEFFARSIRVNYQKVCLRFQSSRWGSCTAKGNLNFNCLLVLCPEEVMDYVIIHELCHRRFFDHSKGFWDEVKKYCIDYKTCQKWLREKGGALIKRIKK